MVDRKSVVEGKSADLGGRSIIKKKVLAAPRVQLPALKLPPPSGTLLAPQLTVPPGAVADSSVLSVTVAVQLLGLPTGTVSGVQLTTVLVACLRAVTSKVPALLRWVPSPL